VPRRSRQHDEELRQVYRRHVRAVYAFFAYSVDEHTAEDLTATTFERVLKAWQTYDPAKAGERTWILSIARNALMDHFRRQKHRMAVSTDEHPALLDALTSTTDPLAERLQVDGVKAWLAGLGERDQQVLALRFGADMSAQEVADALELSVANVHQIASRALRRLREEADARQAGVSGSA
jgi:RNA polymerase sigma factor (sigma-70 family)